MIMITVKIPTIPFPIMERVIKKLSHIEILLSRKIKFYSRGQLAKRGFEYKQAGRQRLQISGNKADNKAACDNGGDLTGYIHAGCLHDEDVARILFHGHFLHHTR